MHREQIDNNSGSQLEEKSPFAKTVSWIFAASAMIAIMPLPASWETIFKHSQNIDLASVLDKQGPDSRFSHIWGKENMQITPEKELSISFPKGSYSPQNSPVSGGGGFIYRLDTPAEAAKLSYEVKFGKWFNPVDGGKFGYGFCSGECPRGGADVGKDFSTRFMWRKNGDMEIYAYIPDKKEVYGKSLGRWFFRFESDRYYKIDLEIALNSPGKNDGTIIVSIDGKEVFRDSRMKFREWSETKIDDVISSSFFWGATSRYAAEENEKIFTKNLTVRLP